MNEDLKILSITPNTTGTFAVYINGKDNDVTLFYESIVCWALVIDEDSVKKSDRHIVGMVAMQDGMTDFADTPDNFVGYCHRLPENVLIKEVNYWDAEYHLRKL
jgi:hypothetical protein